MILRRNAAGPAFIADNRKPQLAAPPVLARADIVIPAVLLIVFATLNFVAARYSVFYGPRISPASMALQCTILGPLSGIIAPDIRGAHLLCFFNGVCLLTFSSPFFVSGLCVQFLWQPTRKSFQWLRLAVWIIGWSMWFAAGFLTLALAGH